MEGKSLKTELKCVLIELNNSISTLTYDEYNQSISLLSNSSIGEHTRHIIELFQQLLDGYEIGVIDYDKRKRNIEIQQSIDFAIECIANIISCVDKNNKVLVLKTLHNNKENQIATNYYRELIYNIEHCIHHQAIIKTAFLYLGKTDLSENFGVAKSTIKYRKQCVQ
ncbi:MAG: DinB family protein [Cytophagales bacterium]|nr:MAG: DinB family protein [Cytophagales bacterium]